MKLEVPSCDTLFSCTELNRRIKPGMEDLEKGEGGWGVVGGGRGA